MFKLIKQNKSYLQTYLNSQETSINPSGSLTGFLALTVENKGLHQNESE